MRLVEYQECHLDQKNPVPFIHKCSLPEQIDETLGGDGGSCWLECIRCNVLCGCGMLVQHLASFLCAVGHSLNVLDSRNIQSAAH